MRKKDLPVRVVRGIRAAGLHPGSQPVRLRVTPSRRLGEKFAVPLLVLPKQSDVLIVSLHAALPRRRLPRFEWLRSMHDRPESQLYISDPTLQLSPTLANGFYLGDDDEDLTPRLARVVRRTAAAIGASRVVLVGYSGGGFAAARVGSLLPESVALAFAARRSLGDPPHGHTVPLLDTVFPGHSGFDALHERLGARVSLADTIPADSDQRIVWIQNSGDEDHRVHQFEPFCKDMGLPLEGGVSSTGTVHLVSSYYGDGHFPPPIEYWQRCLDKAVAYARSGSFSAPVWDQDVPRPDPATPVSTQVAAPSIDVCGGEPGLPQGFAGLVGRATPDDLVCVHLDGALHRTVPVAADGRWRVTPRSFAGRHLEVRAFAHRPGVGRSDDAMAAFVLTE